MSFGCTRTRAATSGWLPRRENRNDLPRNRASRSFSCYRSGGDVCRDGPTAFLDVGRERCVSRFYNGQVGRYRHGRFECGFDCSGRNGLVQSLYLDRRRRLWIGTSRAGVLRVDDITAERPVAVTLTMADGLSSDRIGAITEDRFGRIYVGTERGVDVLDEAGGRIQHFGTAEGLPHPFVGSAYAHPDGEIWLGTLNAWRASRAGHVRESAGRV